MPMLEAPQPSGAGNIDRLSRPQPAKTGGAAKATFTPLDPATGFPASPPPDALAALDRAAKVASELRARKLDVQFDAPDDGPVRVKVVDEGGKVLHTIPVAHALDLLSGDGPGTIFDELSRV
jgi:hypothetical protein